MKVAEVPAIIAKATRIQNNLFNFLSFSKLFSAALTGGSPEGASGSVFSISGTSAGISSIDSFLESFGSTVGSDTFLFEFCQVNF